MPPRHLPWCVVKLKWPKANFSVPPQTGFTHNLPILKATLIFSVAQAKPKSKQTTPKIKPNKKPWSQYFHSFSYICFNLSGNLTESLSQIYPLFTISIATILVQATERLPQDLAELPTCLLLCTFALWPSILNAATRVILLRVPFLLCSWPPDGFEFHST